MYKLGIVGIGLSMMLACQIRPPTPILRPSLLNHYAIEGKLTISDKKASQQVNFKLNFNKPNIKLNIAGPWQSFSNTLHYSPTEIHLLTHDNKSFTAKTVADLSQLYFEETQQSLNLDFPLAMLPYWLSARPYPLKKYLLSPATPTSKLHIQQAGWQIRILSLHASKQAGFGLPKLIELHQANHRIKFYIKAWQTNF